MLKNLEAVFNLDFPGSGLALLLYVPTYESEGLGCKKDLMQKIQPFVFSWCPKFQDNSEIRCRRLIIVCIISVKFLCKRNFQPSAFVMSKISNSHRGRKRLLKRIHVYS